MDLKEKLEKKLEKEPEIKTKSLTKEEIESALNFLVQPDLLDKTGQLIQQSGIVGEVF